jgi:hypothetical protein
VASPLLFSLELSNQRDCVTLHGSPQLTELAAIDCERVPRIVARHSERAHMALEYFRAVCIGATGEPLLVSDPSRPLSREPDDDQPECDSTSHPMFSGTWMVQTSRSVSRCQRRAAVEASARRGSPQIASGESL